MTLEKKEIRGNYHPLHLLSSPCSLFTQPSLPLALRPSFVSLSSLASATRLSCRPLVFLLPRPRATRNSGVVHKLLSPRGKKNKTKNTALSFYPPTPHGQGLIPCLVRVCWRARLQRQTGVSLGFMDRSSSSFGFVSIISRLSFPPSSNVSALKQGLHYWWSWRPPPQPSVCLSGQKGDAGQEGHF